MKTIQKKMLVQVLLGFLLGRVSIYGMNPVAPAFLRQGLQRVEPYYRLPLPYYWG